MNWLQLDSEDIIEEIFKNSEEKRQLIFKYSPLNSISILMRGLFEREWSDAEMEMPAYFLNVHEYPGISKNIEDKLSVNNTTPQVLIIEAGKCIFSASFGGVDYRNIRALSNLRRLIPK